MIYLEKSKMFPVRLFFFLSRDFYFRLFTIFFECLYFVIMPINDKYLAYIFRD